MSYQINQWVEVGGNFYPEYLPDYEIDDELENDGLKVDGKLNSKELSPRQENKAEKVKPIDEEENDEF